MCMEGKDMCAWKRERECVWVVVAGGEDRLLHFLYFTNAQIIKRQVPVSKV